MTKTTKRVLFNLPTVYTADVFKYNGSLCVGAGPEKEGVVMLYALDSNSIETIEPVPGGTMSLIPLPHQSDSFVSVMGLFPPFIGFEGGIHLHIKSGNSWTTTKVLPIPFAHRCDILSIDGIPYLFSASVSKYKNCVEDWSESGQLYVTDLSKGIWEKEVVVGDLWKNHGMFKCAPEAFPPLESKTAHDILFISGAEGIFAIYWSEGIFKTERIFDSEVSEFAFFTLDNSPHLATIEPFHGNTFKIYRFDGHFQKIYESPLEFGHGLSAGILGGNPSVAVGNRRGSMALELIQYVNGEFNKQILEEGVAPTQTKFFTCGGVEYLLSANQNKNEVAIYSI